MRLQKYVADNSRAGFGGLMLDPQVGALALSIAGVIRTQIRAQARASEGAARGKVIAPGHVSLAFSRARVVPRVVRLAHGTFVNPRAGARIEVSTPYKPPIRDDDGNVIGRRSSAVSLEFGSKYNEGAKVDVPRLRVMGRAVRAVAAKYPDVRAKGRL